MEAEKNKKIESDCLIPLFFLPFFFFFFPSPHPDNWSPGVNQRRVSGKLELLPPGRRATAFNFQGRSRRNLATAGPSWKDRKIPERESHPGRRIYGAEPLGGRGDVTLKLGTKYRVGI